MLSYIVRRIVIAVPTLLVIVTIVFFVVRLAPGDPAVTVLGDQVTEAALEAVRERMGLNEPLIIQYLNFLRGAVVGDFGLSLLNGRPVNAQIASVLPHTIQLTLSGLALGVIVGLPLGVVTAVRRNGMIDYIGRLFSLAGLSLPSFYVGILLIVAFAVPISWLPSTGAGDFSDPWDNISHLILPAISLGLMSMAYVTRMTRSVMLNVLSDDHVRTARAKGVSEAVVLWRHALRPALLPVVSLVGLFFVILVGSSVMTEIVFSRPGMGRLMVSAVGTRDYPLLQGCMIVYSIVVVVVNLLTDLVYGFLDPKVQYK